MEPQEAVSNITPSADDQRAADPAVAVVELRKRLQNDWLNRLVKSALQETIGRHGSITPAMVPSAGKRIAGQIRGGLYDVIGRDAAAFLGERQESNL